MNGKLIRVSSKENISANGFIIKASILSKIDSEDIQTQLTFSQEIFNLLKNEFSSFQIEESDIELLNMTSNRFSFSLKKGEVVPKLSVLMEMLIKFENIVQQEMDLRVNLFPSMMTLEQAFLKYASHQV